MPTARKIIQDTLNTVLDTNNKMASVEANFTGMLTGIDAIQDSANSIYDYLPYVVTGDNFNSSVASIQTDYQSLIAGLSTQITVELTGVGTNLQSQLVDLDSQVTNVESNLIPTLATLSYQDVLHNAEVALLTALQSSSDNIRNTDLPTLKADLEIVIGGISTQAINLQTSLDNLTQVDLPAIDTAIRNQIVGSESAINQNTNQSINNAVFAVSSDLAALLTILNALTSNVNLIPTQTYGSQLSALQSSINGISTTANNLPTDRYHDRFNSVQSQLGSIITKQNQSPNIVIPSYTAEFSRVESKQNDHSNKLDSIQSKVDSLPTFNPSSSLTSLHTKTDAQAILVGGVRDTANDIKSDTQVIRNALPNLATKNDTTAINDSLSSLNSSVAGIPRNNHVPQLDRLETGLQASRNEGNNIPRHTYNGQLSRIEGNATSANAGIATVRSEQTSRFNGLDSAIAQVIGGQSNQANSSQANNIYSDTQNIRNNDIPRLATGNQANALSSAIANLPNQAQVNNAASQGAAANATANASRQDQANIPRAIYNSQLSTIQSHANGANAGVATVRTEQSARFNNVDAGLNTLQGQLSGLTGSNGGAASVVSLNTSQLTAPYTASNPERDLIHLLGAADSGYSSVSNLSVGVTANSVQSGDPVSIFNRASPSGWYSSDATGRFVTLDFGLNKSSRTILLTGLGLESVELGFNRYPVTLVILGSNNNSTYTSIFTWSNIGFTASPQWKYTSFSNSTAYRYLRIQQNTLNGGGDNLLGFRQLRVYGSIFNP